MPRPRKHDKYLPQNVRYKNGAYRLRVTKEINNKKIQTEIKLGVTYPEALKKLAEIVEQPKNLITMNDIFDRYMAEVAPLKAESTFKQDLHKIKPLREILGHMKPFEITPVEVYQYRDARSKKSGPIQANREKSLLSHIFTKAIEWGAASQNPCREVKRLPERARDRYIEDWELKLVYDLATPFMKAVINFAYVSGQRQGDILNIKLADIAEDGIYIQSNKTGKKKIIEWSDALRAAVADAKKVKRKVRGLYLFCNNHGMPYTSDGFKSLWQNLMDLAHKGKRDKDGNFIVAPVLEERFTFHDIRAKAASDIDAKHAFELLDHDSMALTERVYRRNIKRVKPVK